MEDVCLHRKARYITLYDEDEGFYLCLGQVAIYRVGFYEFCDTAEQSVQKFLIIVLGDVEQFENPI